MTEAATDIVEEKVADTTETATTTDTETAAAAKTTDDAAKVKEGDKPTPEAAVDFVADPNKTDEENATALAEWEKTQGDADKSDKPGLPDDWREIASAGNEDRLKLAKRYTSMSGVLKALEEAQKVIRSGKVQMDKPDASDEKAMAEWRKAQGIPADPTGYKLREDVTSRLNDVDKPMLSSFTEFAHQEDLNPHGVEVATAWYVNMMESVREQQAEADKIARQTAEDALRKDWAGGEYRPNLTLAKRFADTIPGLGEEVLGVRAPDGRMLGDIPEFVAWAADMGKDRFGDLAFSTSDAERKHIARKEEIEKIRNTDFERYEREGYDKEYRAIIEKDLARKR